VAQLVPVFLGTAFVYAIANGRDEWHDRAVQWQARLQRTRAALLTTEFVLMEIGDGLANLRFRLRAVKIIELLRSSPLVEIVPASSHLVEEALRMYRLRDDKDWGLTDCSSFAVMKQRGISDALTMDQHFQQAGFRPHCDRNSRLLRQRFSAF